MMRLKITIIIITTVDETIGFELECKRKNSPNEEQKPPQHPQAPAATDAICRDTADRLVCTLEKERNIVCGRPSPHLVQCGVVIAFATQKRDVIGIGISTEKLIV
jgi:hypothetical protein